MLTTEGKFTLLSLRLLMARAAQKDSLSWWEDDSLTPSGMYLLDRLFFINPDEAGRKLALEAAKVRYQAAFGEANQAMHLFHLDRTGEIELGLQGIRLTTVAIPCESIQSIDTLRQLLLEQVGSPMKYQVVGERSNNRLEIMMKDGPSQPDLIQIVKTLVWATLESEPGKPVFPYIQQTL